MLSESYKKITDFLEVEHILHEKYLNLVQYQAVLNSGSDVFTYLEKKRKSVRESKPLSFEYQGGLSISGLADLFDIEESGHLQYSYFNVRIVIGVINRENLNVFKKVLFRSLRGNLYIESKPIEEVIVDPTTGKSIKKDIFLIFTHGKELRNKVEKICISLSATTYAVDRNSKLRKMELNDVNEKIRDLEIVNLFNCFRQ